MVDLITKRFDCVLFDLGNTLIAQENPGTPYESLAVQVLPGVQELLAQLQGKVKMGIVSNTKTITAADIQAKLSTVGLDKYFQSIIATAEFGSHKPDPAPITAGIEELQCTAGRTLYVGDVETDKQAALSAGAHFAYAGPNLYESITQYALHSDSAFDRAIHTHPIFSQEHFDAVRKEFDGLAKPVGSRGKLETIAAQIAGITHSHAPTVDPAAIALFGGKDGMDAPRAFIAASSRLLKSGGLLAIEHNEQQGALIADALSHDFQEIQLHQDLVGRPRWTSAIRKNI
jgi:HAD superfamily hydrolase (TIGR01662 family)